MLTSVRFPNVSVCPTSTISWMLHILLVFIYFNGFSTLIIVVAKQHRYCTESDITESLQLNLLVLYTDSCAGKHAERKKRILQMYKICWYKLERLLTRGESGPWLWNCAYYFSLLIPLFLSLLHAFLWMKLVMPFSMS
jgi:hypothetical protein